MSPVPCLYDTQSREIRPLHPLDGKTYRFYCCGPTVYGPAHIGNLRTFVLQDVFRRTLEAAGIATYHVRNLTDVDDKTIRQSQAEGLSLGEFTGRWTKRFREDCAKLNLLPPHEEPSAIAHIPEQIAMIKTLIAHHHAYAPGDGSVYFRITSFGEYGKLSRLDSRELNLGQTQNLRGQADEYEKDNLADFVLWKARRPEDGPNSWPSPWGEGRPGWHLECSAMIEKYLGKDFDLHSGGVDLIFPHHENEIAQSRCACGGHFASHWFHTTHLLVDGAKMSKSLGNLYTVQDVLDRGFTPNELRHVLLAAHYRKTLNFTWDSLAAARQACQRLVKVHEKLSALAGSPLPDGFGPFAPAFEALLDDLNTPEALGRIFTVLKQLERDLNSGGLDPAKASPALAGLRRILATLGLRTEDPLPESSKPSEAPAEIQALAEARWLAKNSKDWPEADRLRQELAGKGWQIKDGKDGYILSPL
jgi:cysteinyl-tRNA synthetase